MEVRIKDNNSYVDADWTIEDGIMVVSPKVEKYMYKEGDVIIVRSLYKHILIYKESKNRCLYSFAGLIDDLLDIDKTPVCLEDDIKEIRPATEEEKRKLFDKLKEEGYEWDTKKKEIIKLKWKPVDHEKVYVAGFTFYGKHPFCPFEDKAYGDSMQWRAVYERGWFFKTEEECQEFCNRLNDAINQVKP